MLETIAISIEPNYDLKQKVSFTLRIKDITFDLERTTGSVLRERSLASGSISAASARGTSSLTLHRPIDDITLPRWPSIALLKKSPLCSELDFRSRVPGNTYSP